MRETVLGERIPFGLSKRDTSYNYYCYFLHLPVFILHTRKYDIDSDEVKYGWWIRSIVFRFQTNYGWWLYERIEKKQNGKEKKCKV
jgi:hypothetical protein